MHLRDSFVRLVGEHLKYTGDLQRESGPCDTKRGLAKHAKNIIFLLFFFFVLSLSFFRLFPKCIFLNKRLSGFSTKAHYYITHESVHHKK